MRNALVIGLVMSVGLGFAAAPAQAANDAATDTLTIGTVLEPPSLDPTSGAAAAIREVTYANIYEGLTHIDEKAEVVPDLATSWTVSKDGLIYTFKLRPGVKFSDGTAFQCSIVKFSYDRAVAPGSTNAQKGLFEPIASTACPDPLTAIVTLKRPAANFLFDMGWGDAVMLAPNSIANDKTNPVGTGPFRVVRWVRGDRIDMDRNPNYWGKPAKLAHVSFRFIADPSAATAALLAGDLDAFPNFPAPEALDAIRANPKFKVVIGTTSGKTILALNDARKPFNDIRVRRALAYAIDRKALVDALSNYGTPIGSHAVPGDLGYVDLTGVYPYNPAKARALLAEAGVKPGTVMTIILPPPAYARRGGEVIAAMLAQVGITARLVPVAFGQWLDQVFKKSDFDMTIIAHVEDRDLDIYARDHYYFNYDSASYKALYRQYQEAVDPAKQVALAEALQRKLAADEPNVFLFALAKIGVWNVRLHGLWHNTPIPSIDVTKVSWSN